MTQALNCAAAGGEEAVKNDAQAIKHVRILRRSFWRGPDWAMFVPPLIIAGSGFDFSGTATMYPNLPQARRGETQHFNVRHKAVNPGWRQPLLWDYFTFARHSGPD